MPWMGNYMLLFYMDIITYPCTRPKLDTGLINHYISKRGPCDIVQCKNNADGCLLLWFGNIHINLKHKHSV